MTKQAPSKPETVRVSVPPGTESPALDERVWQAWLEKNEKRDKVKFARRMRVIGILLALLVVAALVLTFRN